VANVTRFCDQINADEVFGTHNLRRILSKLASYDNEVRTHLALGKDAPCTRPVERFGDIIAQPIL
jgi:hypothetical protein